MDCHVRSKLAPSYSFCVLFLTIMIHPISSGGSRNLIPNTMTNPDVVAGNGICASAVTPHRYKCHELQVQTEDGYILSIQRIPEGRDGDSGSDGKKREPVLIQHGILVDALTWLINEPEQNLPTILADQGYDVWIANSRGTRFSSRHASFQPTQPEYWDWTWVELAKHDLPAVFDYIYNQTRQKIHYVGHSQGTLIAMAALSEGLLVDKMKSAALLTPIAYLKHITSLLSVFAEISQLLSGVSVFDPKVLFPQEFDIILAACNVYDCYSLLDLITGKNCCLNTSTADVFYINEPQPTAYKNVMHYGQGIRNGIVAKFDYGSVNSNIEHYGVPKPPVYNLSRIPKDLPILLSYGQEDLLSVVPDVNDLLDTLKSHDSNKLDVQYIQDYAHLDFIMATNAKDVVYNRVVSFFKNHTSS